MIPTFLGSHSITGNQTFQLKKQNEDIYRQAIEYLFWKRVLQYFKMCFEKNQIPSYRNTSGELGLH
jgi:hypothetical protein